MLCTDAHNKLAEYLDRVIYQGNSLNVNSYTTRTAVTRLSYRECLTLTNRVTGRGAGLYHLLLVAGGAGDARLQRTLLVRVRVPGALLAYGVVVQLAAEQHALALGTLGARLTPLGEALEVVAVVADTDGVVGVRAGCFHAVQTCALCAGLTFLGVTEVF